MNRFIFTTASLGVLFAGLCFFPASASAADPTKPATDPAAAQALFYEARNLMKDGKFALACPKLEESLRLDYGIGTEFNLADCNEKQGKIATAWSGFLSVAAASKTQNQPQREKVARERAKALEPRLPKLAIEVVGTATPGLEVKRDGVVIGSASWGSPVPVDPGSHRITASAPGRQSWEGAVSASEGKLSRITVPPLAGAVNDQTGVAAAPVPVTNEPQPRREPAQDQPQATAFPEPIVERGSTQRTIGWVVAGAGLAGLGVGAGFGLDSLQKRNRANDHCNGDLCDATGVSLRDKAMTSGNVATIVGIAGGAVVLGGLVLVLTAPRGHERKEAQTAGSIRAYPSVGLNGGGFAIEGLLP